MYSRRVKLAIFQQCGLVTEREKKKKGSREVQIRMESLEHNHFPCELGVLLYAYGLAMCKRPWYTEHDSQFEKIGDLCDLISSGG